MAHINGKTIGMITGAIGGVGIGAGLLQGIGIDAAAIAKDVAIVVTEGLFGCSSEPSHVCAAGGRLIEVAALLGLAGGFAKIGHMLAPAPKKAPAEVSGLAPQTTEGTELFRVAISTDPSKPAQTT
jgi:hypothetical protein